MAIDIDDTFTKIGRFGRVLYLANTAQNSMPAGYTSLFAQVLTTYPAIMAQTSSGEYPAIRGWSSFYSTLAQAAGLMLQSIVGADVPSAGRSLATSLLELRRQMIAGSKTVKACTVTAPTSAIAGMVGNGVILTSTKRGDGLVLEHIIAESARVTCTQDSYSGGATAGQELFIFSGGPNLAQVYDWDWPQGSAATTAIQAISATQDAAANGNLLTNGDCESWTADASPQLNNFDLSTGTWGTDALQSVTGYTGSFSLRINATATNTAIYTQFGSTTVTSGAGAGTTVTPTTQTSYGVNFFIRTNSGTAGAGILTVELVDGSGTVIQDAQSVNNSFTVDLTTLTTAWVAKNGVFRLPVVPPSTIRLRFRISTLLTTVPILIDNICFAPLLSAYAGGEGIAIFSGSTPFVQGDAWDVASTNNRGGATFDATFQTLFLRLYSQVNFLLPSSGSPSEADTLITDA